MGARHNMCQAAKRRRVDTLWKIQRGRCAFCGKTVRDRETAKKRVATANGAPRGDDPTLEHVVPRGRGGSNAMTNLLLAHYRCNFERGDGDLPEHVRRVWQANLIALAIERGERAPPVVCGDCQSPHTCEANQACTAFHEKAA